MSQHVINETIPIKQAKKCKNIFKRYGFSITCLNCNKDIFVPFGNTLNLNTDIIKFDIVDEEVTIKLHCEHCCRESLIQLYDTSPCGDII